jgi:hypothetical protein
MDNENNPPTKTLPSVLTSQPEANDAWKRAVGAYLARLALHYWRPDFTAGQAKLLFEDFYSDLRRYPVAEIEGACQSWRRNSANRFFPTPGQLLEVLGEKHGPIQERPRSIGTTFQGYPALEGRRAAKSVADMLRDNGMPVAAEQWEDWRANRTEQN